MTTKSAEQIAIWESLCGFTGSRKENEIERIFRVNLEEIYTNGLIDQILPGVSLPYLHEVMLLAYRSNEQLVGDFPGWNDGTSSRFDKEILEKRIRPAVAAYLGTQNLQDVRA